MIPNKVTRSTAFRLAALFAVIFSLAITLVFAALYFVMTEDLTYYVKEYVEETRGTLTAVGEDQGRDALASVVDRHVATSTSEEDIYLLTDKKGQYVTGNIRTMPLFDGWKTIKWQDLPLVRPWPGEPASTSVVGIWTEVKDGYLFVADGNADIEKAQNTLINGLWWGVAISALSAVLGGLLIGFNAQRRISSMESALGAVALGQLDTRVPRSASQDDLDHVAALINTTLDRLQGLIREVKQVTTDVAHDLKTPIWRVRQKLELAISSPLGAAELRELIAGTLGELDGIVETFEALLRIAEVEAGARRAQFKDVDLVDVLNTVVEALTPVAEDRTQIIRANLGAVAATIRGDKQLLTQLFVNLLANALRHTADGSLTVVTLEARDTGVCAIVADNGPGIPESERTVVFRRLYRLDKSRSTLGSGLGLSLVEAIARLHDATVTLEDNAPGVRAVVTFPRA